MATTASLSTEDFFRLCLGIGRPDYNVAVTSSPDFPTLNASFGPLDGPGLDLVWKQIQIIALQRTPADINYR